MVRYFFQVRRGNTLYNDGTGQLLASAEEVAQAAIDDARSIMASEPDVPPELQSIEVNDETGRLVHILRFTDALD